MLRVGVIDVEVLVLHGDSSFLALDRRGHRPPSHEE